MIRFVYPTSILLLALICLSSSSAGAQSVRVFKCIDHDGHVAFQDMACASGSREQPVAIEPAPAPKSSPDYSRSQLPRYSRQSRRAPRKTIIYSYECRTKSGALFYRHKPCPASIDRSGLVGGGRLAPRERVSGRRIPRLDACRGMRSAGREGREFDEATSTYDRNLGRDPCRRY